MQQKYNINIASVFNPNNLYTRYAWHLWEARNECYNASLLLNKLFNDNSYKIEDYWCLFKYNMLVLYETASIIMLNSSDTKHLFGDIYDFFTNNENIKYNISILSKLLKNNFFRDMRHAVSHFDHEKNQKYFDFITTCQTHQLDEYDFCVKNPSVHRKILSDRKTQIHAYFLNTYYNDLYFNGDRSKDNFKKCFNLYGALYNTVLNIINEMLDIFFNTQTNILEVKANPSLTITLLKTANFMPYPISDKKHKVAHTSKDDFHYKKN